MSVMILLEIKAKPDLVDTLKQTLAAILPDTRAYDGCQRLTAYSALDDGQTLVAVEHWQSKEHYHKYLAWRKETGAMAQLAAMLETEPSIRFFESFDG